LSVQSVSVGQTKMMAMQNITPIAP
jgi:hypothetical protein